MMPVTETGPFRGEVNKLMVSPRHRRRGIARRVMGLLEEVARERGRHLLVSCDRI
jgi:ribosomal protein S18 acetylase RimI-like enzyme